MVDPTKVSGAAKPITINGVDYKIAPLSDKQFDELTNWCRQRHIQQASKAAVSLSQGEYDRIVGIALKQAHEIVFFSSEGFTMADNFDGITEMLYQSLKREQPNIRQVDCRQILDGIPKENRRKELDHFFEEFMQINRVNPKKDEQAAAS